MSGWRHRTSRHQRGYDYAWERLRLVILARDRYLCQCSDCKASGRVRLATQVDHIVPKAKGGTDHPSTLQAINHACHGVKSIHDQGGQVRPRVTVGTDGWPA